MGRYVDGGSQQNGHVGDEPLDAVLGQKADAVSRLDPRIDESRCRRLGLGQVIRPGYILVKAELLEAQGRAGPKTFRLMAQKDRKIAFHLHLTFRKPHKKPGTRG